MPSLYYPLPNPCSVLAPRGDIYARSDVYVVTYKLEVVPSLTVSTYPIKIKSKTLTLLHLVQYRKKTPDYCMPRGQVS